MNYVKKYKRRVHCVCGHQKKQHMNMKIEGRSDCWAFVKRKNGNKEHCECKEYKRR